MIRAFLSYARCDEPFTRRLAAALPAHGIEPWIDREGIHGGARWSTAIQEALRSADVLILVVTPAAMASSNVEDEWQHALDRGTPVLPVLLQPTELHFQLGRIQYVDAHALGFDAALPRLAESVHRALGDEAAAQRARSGFGSDADLAGPPAGAPVAAGSADPPHNLPRGRSSFVGRQRSLAHVTEAIGRHGIVTLTGPGGTGKTRLALHAALQALRSFPQGAWLVDLASLQPGAGVVESVAAGLGLREQPGRPLEATLHDFLQERRLLLLLDNCEHVIDSCATLVESLAMAHPGLSVLATSREALRVDGEHVYAVPALSAPPENEAPPTPETAADYAAVRLFLDRAKAVRRDFALDAGNTADVVELCRRLDGLPLAIELAAARVKAMSPRQILDRLDQRFRLLTAGRRTALPRHQALHETLDWSYRLLDEPEQALLQRLCVFAGGFDLEAAEAVCAGEAVEDWAVLDLLSELVEKSLVTVDTDDTPPRYDLLESVRAFAAQRLAEAGAEVRLRERHLAWAAALCDSARDGLRGEAMSDTLDRLDRDRDNLLAALRWASTEGDVTAGMKVFANVIAYWTVRYAMPDLLALAHVLLERDTPAEQSLLRARALCSLGRQLYVRGESQAAMTLLEEAHVLAHGADGPEERRLAAYIEHSLLKFQNKREAAYEAALRRLALVREEGTSRGLGQALQTAALTASNIGLASRAEQLLEEVLGLDRSDINSVTLGTSLATLANLRMQQGRLEESLAGFQEALDVFRGIRYQQYEAGAHSMVAICYRRLGEPGAAAEHACSAIEGYAALGNRDMVAKSKTEWAASLALDGRTRDAMPILLNSLDYLLRSEQNLGTENYICLALAALAITCLDLDRGEEAAWIVGAAEGHLDLAVEDYDRVLEPLRTQAHAAARAEGAALGIERVARRIMRRVAQEGGGTGGGDGGGGSDETS